MNIIVTILLHRLCIIQLKDIQIITNFNQKLHHIYIAYYAFVNSTLIKFSHFNCLPG